MAITRYVPALCPAVYKPAAEMVPPVAEYATVTATLSPFFFLPYAANCSVFPTVTEAVAGVRITCVSGPLFLTCELPDTVVLAGVAAGADAVT